jgi:hypothetical protein
MLKKFGRSPKQETLKTWRWQFQKAGKVPVAEKEIREFVRYLMADTGCVPQNYKDRLYGWFGKGLLSNKVVMRILKEEYPAAFTSVEVYKPPRSKENGDTFSCLHSKTFPISKQACLEFQERWRRNEPNDRRNHVKLQKCKQCERWVAEISELRGTNGKPRRTYQSRM